MILPIGVSLAYLCYDTYGDWVHYQKREPLSSSNETLVAIAQKILKNPEVLRYQEEEGLFGEEGTPALARGNAFLGHPLVQIDSSAAQDPAREFFYAHEIAHIAHNDGMIKACIKGALSGANLVGLRWLWGSFSVFNAFLFTAVYGVQIVAMTLFSQYVEKRADIRGFSVCSKEGQQAAIQYFQDRVQKNFEAREKILTELKEELSAADSFLQRLFYRALLYLTDKATLNGNDYFAWSHPQAPERVRYLSQMCNP